jgi:hypothetical protein
MARNFSLTFSFEQKAYEAAITVFKDPAPRTITATLTDKHLHQAVPESKEPLLIDVATTHLETKPIDRLKQCILEAFKAHESHSPPVSLW